MKRPTTYYLLFLIAIAICMAILASCTPQKRLARLCDKHPQLCTYDTTVIDTQITHRSVIDSTFYLNRVDTILLERYGVRTQIYRHYDTFTVEQTKTDSIYVVTTEKSKVVEKEVRKLPKWLIWLAVCLLAWKVLDFLSLKIRNGM